MHPRRKGHQHTREKILEHAVVLFSEYGFATTSTRQIVASVGMTNSAIYNHFADKNEILFTIIQRAGERVLKVLRETIEKHDDPEECLKQMILNMLNLFRASEMKNEIVIFIDELYQLPEDLRELCNKQHRQVFDLFINRICDLDDRNLINPINHTVATFGGLGAILWVYHWFRDDGPLPIELIGDEIIKLLFNGLMRRDVVDEDSSISSIALTSADS